LVRLNKMQLRRKEETMVNTQKLRELFKESGMSMTAIAAKSGIARETLYNRLNGIGEFTASEITGLTRTLKLTRSERDEIFLH